MGRICLEESADTPLQAVAEMERAWKAYEDRTCRVEPTIYGIWNTFLRDVNEHKAFFNTSNNLAQKILEGVAKMEDEDIICLPERKFLYTLEGNPDKEGQRHDIGWASLTTKYAFKMGKTPLVIEAQTGINNSWISEAAEKFYSWKLKRPAQAKLFYARYNFHNCFWNFGTGQWRVKSDFTPKNISERYRREIAQAVQTAYRNASAKKAA